MINQINCADIVRLRRYDAVCVAVRHDACVLCFLVPGSENTRHRADIPLSMVESAQAGLAPDQRVRCVARPHRGTGAVVGHMPAATMRRIQAMLTRENTLAASEQAGSRGRGVGCVASPTRSTPRAPAGIRAAGQSVEQPGGWAGGRWSGPLKTRSTDRLMRRGGTQGAGGPSGGVADGAVMGGVVLHGRDGVTVLQVGHGGENRRS
ncbi:hypothetical protein K2X14_10155 [Acetobacter sp. TBRC 12305]|uniref:Uncharacterized protein n=1 Tax=Acetobacter garciniae TaxID=2817435 RepID=A0A939HP91_9PROT|nr:hypothetical protein [Acetobacter garciniae]MBO1326061.1 hypothetical protein [Acetobacter garciniae]MBX0345195.1 hypothetical protein [Acetobacter garciniae]